MKKTFFKMASVVMLGASLVIGFPSCENPEVMNTLKELQESDSISKADLAKLQSLLSQAQKKVAETEQELQKVKENQGGSSKVDLSKIEGEILGINSQLAGWKKLLQERIDSLGEEIPSLEGLAKTEEIPSLEGLASKDDLQNFVSKEDIQGLPTADDFEKLNNNLEIIQNWIWKEEAKSNFHNGHEFVDLGLSVLWATCNIGAEKPCDYGLYFAWGDTKGYAKGEAHTFNWANYFDNPSGDGKTFSTYHNGEGGLKELSSDHDAATQIWGGKWRMPSKDELVELYDEAKIHSEWVTSYKSSGNNGYVFYKKKEGEATYDVNSDVHIFLPAASYRYDGDLGNEGSYGYYWSCSLYDDRSYDAWYLGFDFSLVCTYGSSRSRGRSVRAVLDK